MLMRKRPRTYLQVPVETAYSATDMYCLRSLAAEGAFVLPWWHKTWSMLSL